MRVCLTSSPFKNWHVLFFIGQYLIQFYSHQYLCPETWHLNYTNNTRIPTVRESRTWGPLRKTTSTLAGSANVTKPKPLDRPLSLFFITTQSITSPKRPKYLCRSSVRYKPWPSILIVLKRWDNYTTFGFHYLV